MAKNISRFKIGDKVWAEMNELRFVAVVLSITFYKDCTTYGLHNEEYPWPESYLTIPDKGLKPYYDPKVAHYDY